MQPDLALTFAGGGNRAFYQLGLLNRWGPELLPRVRAVASCSAGACAALVFFSGRTATTGTFWKARCQGITKNLDFFRLLRGERLAPHGRIYRETVLHAMQEGGLERVQKLPFPILVLTAAIPRWARPLAACVIGMAAYNIERRLKPNSVHPSFGRWLGFQPRVFDARGCDTPEQLADLVMASSATPPFTPIGNFQKQALLDGGMVDNVPAFVAESVPGVRRNLILLTRPYSPAVLGQRGTRLYLAPTRPTPISRWDYTEPDLLDETISMGEIESDLHRPALTAFLAS